MYDVGVEEGRGDFTSVCYSVVVRDVSKEIIEFNVHKVTCLDMFVGCLVLLNISRPSFLSRKRSVSGLGPN